jgi:hypothetical protein
MEVVMLELLYWVRSCHVLKDVMILFISLLARNCGFVPQKKSAKLTDDMPADLLWMVVLLLANGLCKKQRNVIVVKDSVHGCHRLAVAVRK